MLDKGQHFETIALDHLQGAGLQLVQRNFRSKAGEIDLICRDGEELVFVEVRYRSNPDYASALESVTPAKQRKLIRTAQVYLQGINGVHTQPCRFDVVAIEPDGHAHAVEWVRNAFTA